MPYSLMPMTPYKTTKQYLLTVHSSTRTSTPYKNTAGNAKLLGASISNEHYVYYAKAATYFWTTASPKLRRNKQSLPRAIKTIPNIEGD
jgi:hypothetical protein